MLTPKQQSMFESIARGHPTFRSWLLDQLDAKTEVLIKVSDIDQLRKAQGFAQCLTSIVENLDGATQSAAHRGSNHRT